MFFPEQLRSRRGFEQCHPVHVPTGIQSKTWGNSTQVSGAFPQPTELLPQLGERGDPVRSSRGSPRQFPFSRTPRVPLQQTVFPLCCLFILVVHGGRASPGKILSSWGDGPDFLFVLLLFLAISAETFALRSHMFH